MELKVGQSCPRYLSELGCNGDMIYQTDCCIYAKILRWSQSRTSGGTMAISRNSQDSRDSYF